MCRTSRVGTVPSRRRYACPRPALRGRDFQGDPRAYELTVTDTLAGASMSYSNPLGQPADAITDTAAFATCP